MGLLEVDRAAGSLLICLKQRPLPGESAYHRGHVASPAPTTARNLLKKGSWSDREHGHLVRPLGAQGIASFARDNHAAVRSSKNARQVRAYSRFHKNRQLVVAGRAFAS